MYNFVLKKAVVFKLQTDVAGNSTNEEARHVEALIGPLLDEYEDSLGEETDEEEINAVDTNAEETIEQNREWLEEHIDPNSGLLDKLRASRIFSWREVFLVKLKGSCRKRNSKLLDYVLKKRQGDCLIAALRDNNQLHIVNYLNINQGDCSIYSMPEYLWL